MPTQSSPPPSSNPLHGHQKVPSGSRPSTAAGPGSRGYRPQQQQNGGSNGFRQTKSRGGLPSEDAGQRGSKPAPAARDVGPREKPPSKDGTVQRTAKEVEGLKDFVRITRESAEYGVSMKIWQAPTAFVCSINAVES